MRESNIAYLRANLLTKREKEQLIHKWLSILGLNALPIKFILLEEKGLPEKHHILGCQGFYNNNYGIVLSQESNEFIIAHELGHIYLFKLTNYLFQEEPSKKAWNNDIWLFKNALLDSFVNYQLFQFLYFHDLYVEEVNNNWFLVPSNPFGDCLAFYLWSYLSYHYILRKKDQSKLLDCNSNLKRTKGIVLRKAENSYKKPIQENIERLEVHLDTFKKVKDTTNYNDITTFILRGLEIIDLWPRDIIESHKKLLI